MQFEYPHVRSELCEDGEHHITYAFSETDYITLAMPKLRTVPSQELATLNNAIEDMMIQLNREAEKV